MISWLKPVKCLALISYRCPFRARRWSSHNLWPFFKSASKTALKPSFLCLGVREVINTGALSWWELIWPGVLATEDELSTTEKTQIIFLNKKLKGYWKTNRAGGCRVARRWGNPSCGDRLRCWDRRAHCSGCSVTNGLQLCTALPHNGPVNPLRWETSHTSVQINTHIHMQVWRRTGTGSTAHRLIHVQPSSRICQQFQLLAASALPIRGTIHSLSSSTNPLRVLGPAQMESVACRKASFTPSLFSYDVSDAVFGWVSSCWNVKAANSDVWMGWFL